MSRVQVMLLKFCYSMTVSRVSADSVATSAVIMTPCAIVWFVQLLSECIMVWILWLLVLLMRMQTVDFGWSLVGRTIGRLLCKFYVGLVLL